MSGDLPEDVLIDSLVPDSYSPRLDGESADHVRVIAQSEGPLPPIVVHRPTMRIIDGMHRLRAARARGATCIAARFFDGDASAAFVLAVELNRAHGLPLSLADRKAAAARIMGAHPQWADRRIARLAGLSAQTVAMIRRSTPRDTQLNTRVGGDGRTRPTDATTGRRLACDVIMRNPGASLREVARAAGISLGTASDVRARLRREESPIVVRRPRLDRRPDRAHVLGELRRDPSLRMTEVGRDLLRLLDACPTGDDEAGRIIEGVPAHCKDTVVDLARDCATAWREFADQLAARANMSM